MKKKTSTKKTSITKKKKKKGFTLIELLAVIIILGVLMIIAIPSVTEYIQSSRKNAYVTTATQYISGARNKINSAEIPIYDVEATYYLPASCVSLEKGGDSPFGELEEAYIVVTYDGYGYDYYFTARDSANMGILLTDEKLLDESRVQSGITNISTSIGIGTRKKIIMIERCDGKSNTEYEALDTIPTDGVLEENIIDDGKETLFSVIQKEAILDNQKSQYVTNETGIDFKVAPGVTNGQGVYIRSGTENDTYPIYYYRGNVKNNNIVFANFCWKIVRTTETGGIKLIYNGKFNNESCNNMDDETEIGSADYNEYSDDNAYVGYMYGTKESMTYEQTHENKNSSNIKLIIDEWFEENLIKYTKYIEDTIWCNDRSIIADLNDGTIGNGVGKNATTYSAAYRVYRSGIPNLQCQNLNDRFTVSSDNGNGSLTYPIALLTADEAILAGNGYLGYSENTYLVNGSWWWTMTPYALKWGDADNFHLYLGEYMRAYSLSSSWGIRPAISLKNNSKVESGTGTTDDPYIIK